MCLFSAANIIVKTLEMEERLACTNPKLLNDLTRSYAHKMIYDYCRHIYKVKLIHISCYHQVE